MILMMFTWVLVFIGLIFLFNRLFQGQQSNGEKWSLHPAINILKERYARGEINAVEFKAKKRDLAG